ncbi:kinesin-like protein KIF21A isoform X2 [Parasteatoda tepidariorum]|uniref:kinesin-like protein KIF21A isoform X2 n=1 Tax=Parasteatoda tepidariorum TaxID=114398 RepID=UPI00077FD390|nr:kinesin-like protein KIF21A isoform X2 [Parasteatoda tepidariorum]
MESSVRVAVRIRPQISSEVFDMCHVCTSVTPGEPQVWLGNDKAFTFDHVYNMTTTQESVYLTCIQDLIEGCFQGYNATILAYGQTGSGKTYTMGTGFDVSTSEDETGVIPRAVNQLFSGIAKLQNDAQNKKITPPEFKVTAQFMELYNEELIDLLDPVQDREDKNKKSGVKIHEDADGQIITVGLTSRAVSTASETLQCLKIGALSRTTASTKMNVQSSRSHAIFTLHIKQQRVVQFESSENEEAGEEFDTLYSKLHFVDLAGSERLKRTGATGERAREGISINCGLLALGNVISALGDKTKKATHVPYRDSKLTRLLQDSLGGNSQTLMIACVSPSDRDFMETLNTLKYANRAKNIRNKISINQDKSSQTISLLRREIQQLQLELMDYKQGKRKIGDDGEEQINDMFHENMFLESENNNLRSRLKALQDTLDRQTQRVTELLAEKAAGAWITSGENKQQPDLTELIQGYMKEIEELRVQLVAAEEMCSQLRKQVQRNQSQSRMSSSPMLNRDYHFEESVKSPYEILREAKQDVKALTKHVRALEKEGIEENGSKEELKKDNENEKEKDSDTQDTNCNVNGDLMNGVSSDDDDDDSSEESDSDEMNTNDTCTADLAQITNDISIKQKLIEALEQSQQRLRMMKHHYEEKLLTLENKIKETESERDRVLANLSVNKNNKSEEKVKKAKEEFAKKLSSLQSELRKMQVIKKEHVQAMRHQAQSERQIQQLKNEVTEMKKTKVRLINKMKEDTHKHQQVEQRRTTEIAQLKKQSRLKENKIRSLEAEKRLKENVLRRKQEEIIALKNSAKPKMSDRVAGRVGQRREINNTFIIPKRLRESPKVAKSRWQSLEKSINQLVINRQSINNMERDMERYLKEREHLIRKLEQFKQKRSDAILKKQKPEIIQDYEDHIETLKANIDYCQANITECQTNIVQMEQAEDDIDLQDVENFVSKLGEQESKYLLAKLVNMAINQTTQVFQKENSIKELEVKLNQSTNSNNIYLMFLERLVEDGNTEVLDFATSNYLDEAPRSQSSTRSSSPVDSVSEAQPVSDSSKTKKRPRKTGLPSEFMSLSLDQQQLTTPAGSCPSVNDPPEKPTSSRLAWSLHGAQLQQELDLDKTLTSSSNHLDQRGIVRVTSAPTSLQDMIYSKKIERSPLSKRRSKEKSHMAELSPAFHRKFDSNSSVIPFPSLSRQSSTETTVSDISPPGSPSSMRKGREDNVFSRLTHGSFRLNKPGSGVIYPFTLKSNQVKNSPLICSHTAEGHSRPVLCLHATDDVLFSGSKDRTVKIWDLGTGKEIQSLSGHPNNVVSVRYSEYTRLGFSVSSAFVKVWDVRENPAKCVQTLCSSGNSNPGQPFLNTPSRSLLMPQGEHQVNDIALNKYGTTLFSAAHNTVKIWDLRMFKAIGKLNGSHQAAIMCLAVDNEGRDKNVVVTGSKDHYIKVFEVSEGAGGVISSKTNLKPPHYDGIQTLAINDNVLYSGSRDMCIKKWNLKNGNHIQSLNQAHKDWICSLSFLSGNNTRYLLSGCRGGFLKIWTTDATQLKGEMKAHSAPINNISTNSSCTFTASSDCTIGIWRLRNNNDLSPDNSNEFPDV